MERRERAIVQWAEAQGIKADEAILAVRKIERSIEEVEHTLGSSRRAIVAILNLVRTIDIDERGREAYSKAMKDTAEVK